MRIFIVANALQILYLYIYLSGNKSSVVWTFHRIKYIACRSKVTLVTHYSRVNVVRYLSSKSYQLSPFFMRDPVLLVYNWRFVWHSRICPGLTVKLEFIRAHTFGTVHCKLNVNPERLSVSTLSL